MGIKCPHCSIMTSLVPLIIQGDDVDSGRTAVIRALTDGDKHNKGIEYAIYICQDCNKQFIAKGVYIPNKDGRGYVLEWSPIYPIPTREVPSQIPDLIKEQFTEAALCFSVGAYLGCTFLCQRILESICQDKGVSCLNDLLTNGVISKLLFDRATEIRLWAGITKHKPLIGSISSEDSEELLNYLDSILNTVYVEPAKYEILKRKRKQIK